MPNAAWHEVVVGAGSAGAVLAARLTENPDRRVLLLEAGNERLTEPAASAPLGTSILSGHNWDYTAYRGVKAEGRQFPYGVGKLLGGSSAVNGAIALRALPGDFDAWAAAGNPEWAWPAVLPYFRTLETDADFTGEAHGSNGPVPVRRSAPDLLDPVASGFLEACRERGIPLVEDINASDVGASRLPSNEHRGRRVSTADAYLEPARSRPNLDVWTGATASRVLFDGDRAIGVEVLRDGIRTRVYADRVTLCAGGINTPLILERSGIGEPERVARLGLPVVTELPGVGADLADHAALVIWGVPQPGSCRPTSPRHQVLARVASGLDRSGPYDGGPDLALFLAGNVAARTVPDIATITDADTLVALSTMLLAPASRGSVHASGPWPDDRPTITLGLATDPADVSRLMTGMRLLWSLLDTAQLSSHVKEMLVWTRRMADDDVRLRRSVGRFTTPMWHPSGTARMGPPTDGSAVVDQRCRVYGTEGLRVVDASVMPVPPRAPTNLSCIMLAERMAASTD
ncbi:GMC family oxidoreductase [Streptomyces sp. NPDC056486]|uniref:GMC family oxidoreductase n=1 Tax=Streptomyces sp. NPDC056486 TaxID=3345835 RepID=UPI0036B95D37